MPGQTLQHRCWDDEYVLYNALSGDTHLLSPPAIHLLQQLQQAPAAEAALQDALCHAFEFDDGADPARETALLLDQLKKLSLIEPCPACLP